MVFMIYIFLGGYVFKLNPKSRVNRIFLLFSLCFAIWAFTFAFFYSASDKQTAWFWYTLSALGRFLYPAVLLNIALIFTNNKFITKNWYNSILLYIPPLIFLYAIFTGPFITQDLVLINSQWYEILITNNGWWFAYNSYYLLYDFAAIVIFLWWGYKSTLLRERRQALIIIVTGVLALTLGTLTNTVFQALNIHILPSMAQIFGLIFFTGIGYAIVKYQLLKVTFSVAAEQIISKITDLVILMDPEGKIINTNPQTENLLGYSESELQGNAWEFLVPDDQDVEKTRNKLENLKESYNNGQYDNQLLKSMEIGFKTKENGKIPVKSFLSLIKDKYGIIGVLLVGQDLRQTRKLQHEIREKVKAQKSARNQAEKLEILNQIIISAHKTDDLPSLLEKILNSTLELSDFSSGGIYLLETRDIAELMHGKNLTPEYTKQFQKIDAEENPFKSVVGKSKFISGPYQELFSNNHGDWDFISAGLVPLIAQNQVTGFITLLSHDHEKFSVSQIEILESLGREVGAAISRIKTEDKIKRSLKEKEILLKEIHHRVKNNMQIISSLLSLQAGYLNDENAVNALKECQGRIMSMAMIHENLYQSDTLSGIKFADYIDRLVKDLFHTYNIDSERVKVNIDADEIILDIDTAIPCGLIVNELITNSLKHAFPDDTEGEISIRMQQSPEGYYNLSLKDNGIGLPEELNITDSTTLGLLLINSLIRQLEGELEVKRNQGTIFLISFKKLEYTQRI